MNQVQTNNKFFNLECYEEKPFEICALLPLMPYNIESYHEKSFKPSKTSGF